MRTTHVLLAKRIAHVAAVYAACTFNANTTHILQRKS